MENLNKDFGNSERYAIYLRKSRADIEAEARGEGETLARHEKILQDLADKMKVKIEKIYKEIVSGENIDARPEMQRLLTDVRNEMWKGIFVVEVERLARGETMDQGLVSKAFKISNTKIITPMKIYDPNNEFDEEYFEFGLFMSRREYKTINRRLQRGRISSVNEGKYVGSVAPYGYERVKIKGDKGYTLKTNKEANVVKIIFDLYTYENMSLNEVTKKINEMGLKPRKNKEWSVASVKDILSNPVYIGKIKWNWRKEVKIYINEKLVKTRPRNDNYILKNGLHKAIIDEQTWEVAQSKRNLKKSPIPRDKTVKNPLCGLVYCAKCGNKMKRRAYSDKRKEPTIYCAKPNCDNISSKLVYVEDKIIEGLRKWLQSYKFNYSEYIQKTKNRKIQNIEETIKLLEEESKKEKGKLLSIFNFLEDGTYTKEMFEIRNKVISQNIMRINNSIKEYKEKLCKVKCDERDKEIQIENLLDIYDYLKTAEEKNNLLKTILKQVTYLKTEKALKKNADPTNFVINLYPKINKSPTN